MPVPESLLDAANLHLIDRNIAAGAVALQALYDVAQALPATEPGVGQAVGCLAQWVDLGVKPITALNDAVRRFDNVDLRRLLSADYVSLTLARGLLAFLHGNPPEAITHFDLVIAADAVSGLHLASVARHYKGRCLRRVGDYDDALQLARDAHTLALRAGEAKTAAVIAIMLAWLHDQNNYDAAGALKTLDEAEQVLQRTDDHTSMAFLLTARSRIKRRTGYDAHAVELLRQAVDYMHRTPNPHPNLPRILANLAFAIRLDAIRKDAEAKRIWEQALDRKNLLKTLGSAEELSARLTRAGISEDDAGLLDRLLANAGTRDFITLVSRLSSLAEDRSTSNALADGAGALRQQAYGCLKEAEDLYKKQENDRGRATVHLYRGFLHHDADLMDEAWFEADESLKVGMAKGDRFLCARSRILQCMAILGLIAGADTDSEETVKRVEQARGLATRAVEDATETQSPRLQGKAQTWLGLSLLAGSRARISEARTCYDEAREKLERGARDYAWTELLELKIRLDEACDTHNIQRRIDELLHEQAGLQAIVDEIKVTVYRRELAARGGTKAEAQENLKLSNSTAGRLDKRLQARERQPRIDVGDPSPAGSDS